MAPLGPAERSCQEEKASIRDAPLKMGKKELCSCPLGWACGQPSNLLQNTPHYRPATFMSTLEEAWEDGAVESASCGMNEGLLGMLCPWRALK